MCGFDPTHVSQAAPPPLEGFRLADEIRRDLSRWNAQHPKPDRVRELEAAVHVLRQTLQACIRRIEYLELNSAHRSNLRSSD
jgi:hypothetical protein